ncbi:hypothetical protein CANCADRAFT_140309 [Tortispora caseinolytica NRRL Y-17796]|uniref:C2H2-type domain-containing protein n=1 Tax=Tortispora caseinolytica NRRL Y-17796 TaxID=767744 RepID=A0A1E4TCN2_9ASCO|nr:hypothetical protein CANCADRAFT_140309 [Tortispora caseinolytica NRRL Y-17796]
MQGAPSRFFGYISPILLKYCDTPDSKNYAFSVSEDGKTCPLCDWTFGDYTSLLHHLDTIHEENLPGALLRGPDRYYTAQDGSRFASTRDCALYSLLTSNISSFAKLNSLDLNNNFILYNWRSGSYECLICRNQCQPSHLAAHLKSVHYENLPMESARFCSSLPFPINDNDIQTAFPRLNLNLSLQNLINSAEYPLQQLSDSIYLTFRSEDIAPNSNCEEHMPAFEFYSSSRTISAWNTREIAYKYTKYKTANEIITLKFCATRWTYNTVFDIAVANALEQLGVPPNKDNIELTIRFISFALYKIRVSETALPLFSEFPDPAVQTHPTALSDATCAVMKQIATSLFAEEYSDDCLILEFLVACSSLCSNHISDNIAEIAIPFWDLLYNINCNLRRSQNTGSFEPELNFKSANIKYLEKEMALMRISAEFVELNGKEFTMTALRSILESCITRFYILLGNAREILNLDEVYSTARLKLIQELYSFLSCSDVLDVIFSQIQLCLVSILVLLQGTPRKLPFISSIRLSDIKIRKDKCVAVIDLSSKCGKSTDLDCKDLIIYLPSEITRMLIDYCQLRIAITPLTGNKIASSEYLFADITGTLRREIIGEALSFVCLQLSAAEWCYILDRWSSVIYKTPCHGRIVTLSGVADKQKKNSSQWNFWMKVFWIIGFTGSNSVRFTR